MSICRSIYNDFPDLAHKNIFQKKQLNDDLVQIKIVSRIFFQITSEFKGAYLLKESKYDSYHYGNGESLAFFTKLLH